MTALKCVLTAACFTAAFAANGGILAEDSTMSCPNQEFGITALLQSKAGGTDCEAMCKSLGAYPNCQCPGFGGQPASAGDGRDCYTLNCQDPSSPCPNDPFVNCVKENTAAFLMQMKTSSLDVPCENMCKNLGAYPNCQCPGFGGQPASADDGRSCYTQNCQDPSSPCPNDSFANCVKENTKAFLQWQAVFNRVSTGFDSMLQVARLANAHKGAAPNAQPYKAH
jgi:hypothetical protein